MFSIIQKGQDSINVEDLDTIQTEIESSLVNVMQKKWQLEADLQTLVGNNTLSSDPNLDINSQNNHQNNNNINLRKTNYLSSASSVNYSSASSNCSVSSDSSVEGSVLSGTTNTTSTTAWTESSNVPSTHSFSSKRNSRSTTEDRPSKRFKLESPTSYSKRPPHSKHRSKVVPNHNEETIEVVSKLAFRNDTPDKFWPFVEQFCAAPTDKEIEALEDMLKSYEEDKDYFKIPNLGRRNQGNKDNKSTDQKGSPSKSDNNNKNNKSNSISTGSVISPKSPSKSGTKSKLSKGEITNSNASGVETSNRKSPNKPTSNRQNSTDEEACLGALTQRLVSCLIEENLNSFNEVEAELGMGNISGNKKNHKFRNFDLGNVKLLEKKIRTTLEEHHILTKQDDISFGSEDDDVLRELRCCQNELSLIQTYNKEAMVSLIARAKQRTQLEEMREKLRSANADVIDSYHKLIQAKQKKRNPTKKEKDAAWKAIEEQETIFRRCEELSLN